MAANELKEKPAGKFWEFLPKLLPYLACSLAGVAFIFTFVIGVSSGSATSYIYDYFGKAYEGGFLNSAMKTAVILGTVVVAIGLLAVAVFTGFTIFFSVKKLVKK